MLAAIWAQLSFVGKGCIVPMVFPVKERGCGGAFECLRSLVVVDAVVEKANRADGCRDVVRESTT